MINNVKINTLDEAFVNDDICPQCLGDLDTGWECNDCGYDAIEVAKVLYNLEDVSQ